MARGDTIYEDVYKIMAAMTGVDFGVLSPVAISRRPRQPFGQTPGTHTSPPARVPKPARTNFRPPTDPCFPPTHCTESAEFSWRKGAWTPPDSNLSPLFVSKFATYPEGNCQKERTNTAICVFDATMPFSCACCFGASLIAVQPILACLSQAWACALRGPLLLYMFLQL